MELGLDIHTAILWRQDTWNKNQNCKATTPEKEKEKRKVATMPN